jgi:hypothetical protein
MNLQTYIDMMHRYKQLAEEAVEANREEAKVLQSKPMPCGEQDWMWMNYGTQSTSLAVQIQNVITSTLTVMIQCCC